MQINSQISFKKENIIPQYSNKEKFIMTKEQSYFTDALSYASVGAISTTVFGFLSHKITKSNFKGIAIFFHAAIGAVLGLCIKIFKSNISNN